MSRREEKRIDGYRYDSPYDFEDDLKCGPNQIFVRGYRKEDGTKVHSYCRDMTKKEIKDMKKPSEESYYVFGTGQIAYSDDDRNFEIVRGDPEDYPEAHNMGGFSDIRDWLSFRGKPILNEINEDGRYFIETD